MRDKITLSQDSKDQGMPGYGSDPNPPSESTSVVNTQQDMSVSDDGKNSKKMIIYSDF
jgi:hypothetical protein